MEHVEYNATRDDEFRAMVREFIEQKYPKDLRFLPRRVRMDEILPWWNALVDKGWIAPNWPREWGGMALDPGKMVIYLEEMERYGVMRAADQGITQVGPILMKYGTQAQKDYFLERTRIGEIIWAQGYSEPNAGSDLANLQTSAVMEGDEFVINGMKIWTSF